MVIGILSISNTWFAVLKTSDLNSTVYTSRTRFLSFFDSPDALRKFRIFFHLNIHKFILRSCCPEHLSYASRMLHKLLMILCFAFTGIRESSAEK
jgi:hypothetical protein